MFEQSDMNLGTLGHVDHGKTTLVYALTHTWTDIHSESIKRSMTIKLGYADMFIRRCNSGDGAYYTTYEKCRNNSDAEPFRKISLLDAPGHETLMATAIAGSSIIDGALFVISAAEPCPMPQTREHLMIINALGIKKAVIVQTKIDIVGKDAAKKHYEQIRNFIKGSVIENASVVPVMANKEINIDALLDVIVGMDVPQRNTKSDPIMYIARSFDVNKPGTKIQDLVGGVVGGSIIKGEFKEGDEVEIKPGINVMKDKQKREVYEPIITRISRISAGSGSMKSAVAGGLVAIGTDADPSFTKADGLVGQVIGKAGRLPETVNEVTLNYTSLERSDIPKQAFRQGEPLILGIGTGTVVGHVKGIRRSRLEIMLNHPACIDKGMKISVMRNFAQRWRLSGYGVIA